MKRVLWIIILLAALSSLGVFAQRWMVESPNRRVEIVYDLPSLMELSAKMGPDLDQIFADLKSAGIETIAIQPASVGEMLLRAEVLPAQVRSELPKEMTELAKLLTLPVAFEQEHFELVQEAGLKAAPKINTAPWNVEPLWLAYDPKLLIVSGQGALEMEQLNGREVTLALVEFSTPQIRQADAGTMTRLHSISAPEMLVLSEERILNRYVRAVKERNIRVLYMRPYVHGDQNWQRSLDFLGTLQDGLERAGFSTGQARPFASWNPGWIWTAVAGAGIWAAAALYALDLFPHRAVPCLWGGFLAWALSLILLMVAPLLAKQGLALVAAIVFPCLALRWAGLTAKSTFWRYWSCALVSMLGALFVVATLSGTEFLVKLQEFRGVKVAHVIPIALVVYTLARPLRDWLNRDVPIRYLIIAGLVGLAGVIYVLRTGNFGVSIMNLEVQAREFLENLLFVRPRTKELFLGHPALYFALRSRQPHKSWWLPVAVIGQISLVNTFTHIHTFLAVSLLRTFYGLLFGYALGWLAVKVFDWGKRWMDRDHGFRILRLR